MDKFSFWSLGRILLGLGVGLLLASLLDASGLTRKLGSLLSPLARFAHLSHGSAAAFSLAFFSPTAANALLSEQHSRKEITDKELILTNLFNSLPTYMTHLPSLVLMILPVLGFPALMYALLTLLAAGLRTGFTVLLGRLLLPSIQEATALPPELQQVKKLKDIFSLAWARFKKRLPRIFGITIPVCLLMSFLQHLGVFANIEAWLANNLSWATWIKPQAAGIIMLSLLAEVSASISAAGTALYSNSLTSHEIVLALLIGNILSTPMRAIRHQLPMYAGYFNARLAIRLIISNQILRAASMVIVTWAYFVLSN